MLKHTTGTTRGTTGRLGLSEARPLSVRIRHQLEPGRRHAIAHGDLETSTTLRDEITTLIVRAFLQEKEHRASAVDCARTNARELHGRCAVVLPAIADALRDVRAYEERLVAHQRAAIEALEAIPGAVAARAHASGPA